jgi:PAS domain S-box-containing protein
MQKKPTYQELEERLKELEEELDERKRTEEPRNALHNSRTLEFLESGEERFQSVVETANDAIICIDSHGNIDFWNHAARKIFGYSANEALGKPLTVLMPERFRDDYQGGMNRMVATGRSSIIGKTVDMVGLRKDGSEFPMELSVAAWKTKEGMFFTGIVRDVTRRKQAEKALKKAHDELEKLIRERTAELAKANEQLEREVEECKRSEQAVQEALEYAENIVDTVHEALVVLDAELRVRSASHSFYQTFKVTSEETEGQFLYEIGNGQWDIPKLRELLEKIIPENTFFKDFEVEHDFGAIGHKIMRMNARRMHRKTDKTQLIVLAIEDVTEKSRSVERLKRSEASLSEVQRIAHLGNWDWNILTNELQWSDEIYRIFGLTPKEFGATYEAFLNSVHPDDREFVKKAVDEALYRRKPYSIDHRIVLPDRTERIVHEQGGVTFDGAGRPIRMIGTVHDITGLKRAEEALRRSGEELRRLSSRLLEVQENERKRIAGELHDSIGQSLTAIKLGLENAVSRIPEDAPRGYVESLEALIPVVQQASEEVRQIHTDLRPSMLDDLGIVSTISWFCREFERLYSGTKITKEMDIEEKEVPEPLKIVIFRVLQEALNNVAKYGKADLVRVLLKETEGQIELAIEDNGQGFDVEHVRSWKSLKKGFGLISMKERTELSGGSFSIKSAPGEGTVVRASWPYKGNRHNHPRNN